MNVEALHDELVSLREENARLREERFRPVAPTMVPARLATVLATLDGDEADDVSGAWLEIEMIREGLNQALADLRVLVDLVEAQLRESVPVAELDRRMRDDRRRTRQPSTPAAPESAPTHSHVSSGEPEMVPSSVVIT